MFFLFLLLLVLLFDLKTITKSKRLKVIIFWTPNVTTDAAHVRDCTCIRRKLRS